MDNFFASQIWVYVWIKCLHNFTLKKYKLYGPFFMDRVQLSQGYRATTRRQFTFYHSVTRSSWYSFNQSRKDERLSSLRSHSVVLSPEHLDLESSTLTTRLYTNSHFLKKLKYFKFYIDSLYLKFTKIWQTLLTQKNHKKQVLSCTL